MIEVSLIFKILYLYLSVFYNFPPVNNITSEIFKKKEVRQCQKRGKDKVRWDPRGRGDPFCQGVGGVWGQGRSWRWGDPGVAIAEVRAWTGGDEEVDAGGPSGHHTFPEHRGPGVEQWLTTVCARYCSKHVTKKFNPHSNPIRWACCYPHFTDRKTEAQSG